jgi:hypothetical protein
MAEITITASGVVSNGNFRSSFAPGTISVTQNAIGGHMPIIAVGTSEEVLSFGDIGTLGYVAFRNLDATNYVEIGPEASGALVSFIKLKAGNVAIMRLTPGITVRAKANTASVKLQMWALED